MSKKQYHKTHGIATDRSTIRLLAKLGNFTREFSPTNIAREIGMSKEAFYYHMEKEAQKDN